MKNDKLVEERLKLFFGESLVMGNINDISKLQHVNTQDQAREIAVEKFGLFEVASPNFHTYYPDITEEDLKPKDSEFITPLFRALSAVTVNKRWNPVDFAKNGVLKASMNKLVGQTIFANHEAIVGNEIGAVADVAWQESYTTDNGVVVPAGINAVFKIDGKAHPNIARKLQMTPPAIHSNSVTVQFLWEQSHPKLDRNEFLSKAGTYGSDGQLIRKVASDIVMYHETSLVAHGADPYAQLLDKNGTIINPKYASSVDSLSAEDKAVAKKYFHFSYKNDLVSLSSDLTILTQLNNNNPETITENLMKKELIALLALIGFTAADPEAEVLSFQKDGKTFSLEEATATLTQLQETAQSVETLTQKITTLEDQVTKDATTITALTAEVADLKTKNIGEEALTAFRETVTANYRKLKGDKADAAYITSLGSMNYVALNSLNADYEEQLNLKYPMVCQSCQSTEVQRSSAAVGPDAGDTGKGKAKLSHEETLAKLEKARREKDPSTKHLHGNS